MLNHTGSSSINKVNIGSKTLFHSHRDSKGQALRLHLRKASYAMEFGLKKIIILLNKKG